MCLDQVGHDLCEFDLVLQSYNFLFGPWQER
jgi:hypothetical protein